MHAWKTVVLSGGALRGFALLGSLQALYDRGKLVSAQKYIGTSIGAIIGYLLCIGYTPVEIMVYLCQEKCIEYISSQIDVIHSFSGKGMLPFSPIRSILETMTLRKSEVLLTLKALRDHYGKQLVCCTYNYTRGELEFLDDQSHPHLGCLEALQMSSSLPFLFEPFCYQNCLYLDGALISNFPLFHTSSLSDIPILGIRFRKTKRGNPCFVQEESSSSSTILEFCYQLLTIPTDFMDQLLNDPLRSNCSLIEIDLSDCDHFFNFHLSNTHRFDMFSRGYESSLLFLESSSRQDGQSQIYHV